MAEPSPSALGPIGEALPDALLLVTPDGGIVDANRRARRLLGTDCDPRHLGACIEDDEKTALLDYLAQCARSRDPLPGGFRIRGTRLRLDGMLFRERSDVDPVLLLVRLRPRVEDNAEFRLLNDKVDELSREIARRRRVESLLDAQRNAMELVATERVLEPTLEELVREAERQTGHHMKASILLLDETGTRLHRGIAPSLPKAYNDLIDGIEIGPSVGSCGTAAYRNEMVVVENIETDPLWADYRDVAREFGLAACWSTPINDVSGRLLGTFAMYYDRPAVPSETELHIIGVITRTAAIAIERHEADSRIEQLLSLERALRERAESASRAKNDFLALVSHELRNPLHAMLGWTRLLRMKDGGDAETLETGLEIIERNVELQSQLIGDLLDFSRITTGKLRLAKKPLKLASVVTQATDSLELESEQAGVTMVREIDDAMPDAVGDADRLQQVVCNLIGNALKFTPRGGRVWVRLRRAGRGAEIQVEDTGEGIDAAFLPHVFERFEQSDVSSTRAHAGLGLGLAIVRHIVEGHGGQVHARSDGPGTGACFTVTLPVGSGEAAVARESASSAPLRLDDLRVLVVDDEPDACALLRAALGRFGAEVVTATSCQTALEVARAEMPDCLVSDIAMPGRDGYDLVRAFRELPDGDRRPCVAITAYAQDTDRHDALQAGFDFHLSKPVDPVDLATVLARLSSGSAAAEHGDRAMHDVGSR